MASKRLVRRRQCASKQAYPTYRAAELQLRLAVRRTGESLHVYECSFGAHFHLGHLRGCKQSPVAAKRAC